MEFLRLLRLSGKAKRHEQSAKKAKRKEYGAKRKSKNLLAHLSPHAFRLTTHAYRITLSARYCTLGGIVRPICLAAFRLMTSSNFLGCSTGRSPGFAPFTILSTYVAARLSRSGRLTP